MATADNRSWRVVAITGTRLAGSDQHAEYEISVDGKSCSWRRYREFDDLCNTLRKLGIVSSSPLPPKKLFGGNSQQVVAERKTGLEAWLVGVVHKPEAAARASAIISAFLETEFYAPSVPAKPNQGQTHGATIPVSPEVAKLREVVSRFSGAALAPSPFSSLSKGWPSPKENPSSASEFNPSEFRSLLEASENVFVVLRPSKPV